MTWEWDKPKPAKRFDPKKKYETSKKLYWGIRDMNRSHMTVTIPTFRVGSNSNGIGFLK